MRTRVLASALLLTTLSSPSFAQSPADHQSHHPDEKEPPAPKRAAPPEMPRSTAPTQGMTGSGMSGGGMMGGGVMGSNMPTPDMMRMMGMMRQSGDGMDGAEMIDHVEGRIAFLRTELKITEVQRPAWDAFADALRTNAKTLADARGSMTPRQGVGSPSLVEKLTLQEKWLAARLEGTRAMKSALSNLIASFSDEQAKAADELLAPQMGMMPMTQGERMGAMRMGNN